MKDSSVSWTSLDSTRTSTAQQFARFSVAIIVSPDLNVTSFDKITTPGQSYGLTFSYRFHKRFTLGSGIIRSAKRYTGYGEDYSPPSSYWKSRTNGIVPSEINGECAVIEVPVFLQYDAIQNAGSRLYIAGGLSSYRMISENYRYEFSQDNAGAATAWSSSKPNNYFLAVSHISAGYERRLGKTLSVAAEPYMEIPIREIGWTNIKLFTMGMYFSVRYAIK